MFKPNYSFHPFECEEVTLLTVMLPRRKIILANRKFRRQGEEGCRHLPLILIMDDLVYSREK